MVKRRWAAVFSVLVSVFMFAPEGRAIRFSKLEVGPAKTINVPGDAATIQAALDMASRGDTVSVAAGTYNENLVIFDSHLTLQGAGAASTTIAGGGSRATIELSDIRDVVVSGFTITNSGSQPGILLDYASVSCEDNILTGNSYGLRAQYNSNVWVRRTQATLNSEAGLRFTRGASGFIADSSFTGNGDGIIADRNASLYAVRSTMSDNTKDGANAWLGGNITLDGCDLDSNGKNGFGIGGGSTGMLYNGSTISNNNGAGIFVSANSFATLGAGDKVDHNDNSGIFLINGSSLTMNAGSVSQNDPNGVDLHNGSTATFESAAKISGNAEYGVRCHGNYTSYTGSPSFPNPVNVLGNTYDCDK